MFIPLIRNQFRNLDFCNNLLVLVSTNFFFLFTNVESITELEIWIPILQSTIKGNNRNYEYYLICFLFLFFPSWVWSYQSAVCFLKNTVVVTFVIYFLLLYQITQICIIRFLLLWILVCLSYQLYLINKKSSFSPLDLRVAETSLHTDPDYLSE